MSNAQQPPPFTPAPPPYPPAPPPLPSSQRYPTWKQAFVMFGGGLALIVSATFGCAVIDSVNLSVNLKPLNDLFVLLILVGLAASAFGVLLIMLRMMREVFSPFTKKDEGGDGSGTAS